MKSLLKKSFIILIIVCIFIISCRERQVTSKSSTSTAVGLAVKEKRLSIDDINKNKLLVDLKASNSFGNRFTILEGLMQ